MRQTRFYRGHRIVAFQLDDSWHAMIHGHTGKIIDTVEGTSLADAMAYAEWVIETRLRFAPERAA